MWFVLFLVLDSGLIAVWFVGFLAGCGGCVF